MAVETAVLMDERKASLRVVRSAVEKAAMSVDLLVVEMVVRMALCSLVLWADSLLVFLMDMTLVWRTVEWKVLRLEGGSDQN